MNLAVWRVCVTSIGAHTCNKVASRHGETPHEADPESRSYGEVSQMFVPNQMQVRTTRGIKGLRHESANIGGVCRTAHCYFMKTVEEYTTHDPLKIRYRRRPERQAAE